MIARLIRWLTIPRPIDEAEHYWSQTGDELPPPIPTGWTDQPATYACPRCDDRGTTDHAGFAMEPCPCRASQP